MGKSLNNAAYKRNKEGYWIQEKNSALVAIKNWKLK